MPREDRAARQGEEYRRNARSLLEKASPRLRFLIDGCGFCFFRGCLLFRRINLFVHDGACQCLVRKGDSENNLNVSGVAVCDVMHFLQEIGVYLFSISARWLTGMAKLIPEGWDNAASFVPLTKTMLMIPMTSPLSESRSGPPLLPGYAVPSSW